MGSQHTLADTKQSYDQLSQQLQGLVASAKATHGRCAVQSHQVESASDTAGCRHKAMKAYQGALQQHKPHAQDSLLAPCVDAHQRRQHPAPGSHQLACLLGCQLHAGLQGSRPDI